MMTPHHHQSIVYALGQSGKIQPKWKQEGESKLNKSGVASLDHFCSVLIRLPASTLAEFPLRNLNGLIVREWNRWNVHNIDEPQRETVLCIPFNHLAKRFSIFLIRLHYDNA